MALRFLLDANISPETAIFLRSLGFDTKSLIEKGLGGLEDAAVAAMAQKEKRILITFDLDFGELYYFSSYKYFRVIVLRLDDQRVASVNSVLKKFLEGHLDVFKKKGRLLAVISENDFRVILG